MDLMHQVLDNLASTAEGEAFARGDLVALMRSGIVTIDTLPPSVHSGAPPPTLPTASGCPC